MHWRQLVLRGRPYGFRIEPKTGLMLGAPFRAGTTHVVQLRPLAVAHVLDQVVNDAGEVGG
jgi:hypothetical protein